MDDILKRLGTVESQLSDIRAHVAGLAAQFPHLATKADISGLISRLETSLIKWLIGTVMGVAALAFSVAKFIH